MRKGGVSMLRELDLQMIIFVGISLLQDYLRFSSSPRIYYFSNEECDDQDDERVA